jgi:hypothetical protein
MIASEAIAEILVLGASIRTVGELGTCRFRRVCRNALSNSYLLAFTKIAGVRVRTPVRMFISIPIGSSPERWSE